MMGRRVLRALLLSSALLALAWSSSAIQSASASGSQVSVRVFNQAQPLTITPLWRDLLGGNSAVFESSPNIASLDSQGPSIVVGSRFNGLVYAVHLTNGTTVGGWPRPTGFAVDAAPSVLASGTANRDNVYVTAGDVTSDSLNANNGAMFALGPGGNVLWQRFLADVFQGIGSPAVFASPAIGDTGVGGPAIVAGDVGLALYSVNPATGQNLGGWPQKMADSTFSTAAIANINGVQQIISASDSTAGASALNNWNGGSVRRMTSGGQTAWTVANNEVVTSSPAVGNLNGSGPVAVFGHGLFWGGSDQDGLTAVNAQTGQVLWEQHLGGYTRPSPALADLLGNGQLDIVEPTWRALGSTTGGTVRAFAPNGSTLWGPIVLPEPPGVTGNPNTVTEGVATADFGEGYQDVVVSSGLGWDILDGRTGQVVSSQTGEGVNVNWDGNLANLAMENSPLITPDPLGRGLDVVVSGRYSGPQGDQDKGFIAAYLVSGSHGVGPNAWPQFHHDPQLTGSSIPPAPPPGTCIPDVPPCSTEGYWAVASDGGIFDFGAAVFAGSAGSLPLNAPVVGMTKDPATGGYWLVASDGGIFSYNAPFFGSTGNIHLNQPIVGIAATADGRGYWLVARDGGVFSFGDASFQGSMGARPLNQPVVGMAGDPSTGGYWLVASDGGIFSFAAPFYGSTGSMRLNQPIVGMTATGTGNGYRFVAADGGVFDFGAAGFFGSMGGRPLNQPVVGMSNTSSGNGYWLVASDGGMFSFGDAFFRGSMGGMFLNAPVVGLGSVG